jgi:hypothetical protein
MFPFQTPILLVWTSLMSEKINTAEHILASLNSQRWLSCNINYTFLWRYLTAKGYLSNKNSVEEVERFSKAPCYEHMRKSWGMDQRILNLATRSGRVTSFTSLPLCPWKGYSCNQWTTGWLSSRAGLDVLEYRQISYSCQESDLDSLVFLRICCSLQRRSYPCSIKIIRDKIWISFRVIFIPCFALSQSK